MPAAARDDFEGVESFDAGGERYHAVIGMRAIKAVEAYYDLPFAVAIRKMMPQIESETDLADPAKVAAAAAQIRITDLAKLFEFALRKHHSQLTEDDVDDIVDAIGMGRMSEIIGVALPAALAREGDGESTANPRPRRASRAR